MTLKVDSKHIYILHGAETSASSEESSTGGRGAQHGQTSEHALSERRLRAPTHHVCLPLRAALECVLLHMLQTKFLPMLANKLQTTRLLMHQAHMLQAAPQRTALKARRRLRALLATSTS
eukprot:scaffold190242_cov26-Tisochrysis_lutea.AAC.1